jgi:hypothetical protein
MNMQEQFDAATPPFAFKTISAADLQKKVFPAIKWIVPDILTEGLTLLCGKPKLGKSWFALDIAQAVTSGGAVLGRECEAGAALYLALEDNERRLQKRLQHVQEQGQWPADLDLVTEAPKLGEGCLRGIRQWCAAHPDARIVIIDTLATVRPAGKRGESDYVADYAALRGLQGLAGELGIAIVVVHHVRKAEAEDPFDTVSGSTGLTGAADATLILTKRTGDGGCVLYGRGRDLAEFELAVEFDTDTCRWRDLGDPMEAFASDTRQKIFTAIKAGKRTPAAITEMTGISADNARQTLGRMVTVGDLTKEGRGLYHIKSNPLTPCHNSHIVTMPDTESDNVTNVTGLEEG